MGNPGSRYERTRHNVGFRVVEAVAGGASWRDFQGLGRCARVEGILLGEPETFMNESGRFVSAALRYFKIAPGETLVCFDDVALPLGRLRLRASGSSGGHRGMQSVIDMSGTPDIPRLRLGVGPQPAGVPSEDFVLARFSAEQEKSLAGVLGHAVEAVETAVREGLPRAMDRFNASIPGGAAA